MRCDQCRHWRETDELRANNAGFRECVAVRRPVVIEEEATSGMKWPFGPHVKWRYNNETLEDETDDPAANEYINARIAALKSERAYVQGVSEFPAQLYTGPDFFCAKFEAEPEAAGGAGGAG